jgi:hypothetical protein
VGREIAALTVPRVHTAARVITVDHKVIEVAGHLYLEAPNNRKRRKTIYSRTTPSGSRWPSGSPPASSRPARNGIPAITRWDMRGNIGEIVKPHGHVLPEQSSQRYDP